MAVTELEKVIDANMERKPVRSRPEKWNALLVDHRREGATCVKRILSGVFNLSSADAHDHLDLARTTGRSVLLTSSRDVVETKCGKAERILESNHAACWSRSACGLAGIAFVAEPA